MKSGPVMIARYENEILAVQLQQYLADNGIEAFVFTGGIIMNIPCYEVHVPAEKEQEAGKLLEELETADPAVGEEPDDIE